MLQVIDIEYNVEQYDYEEYQGYGSFRFVDEVSLFSIMKTIVEISNEREEEDSKALTLDSIDKLLEEKMKGTESNELWKRYSDVDNEDFEQDMDFTTFLEEYTDSWAWVEALEDVTGYRFGKVGYSPWTYYVAHDSIDEGLVSDVWDGYNIYNISVLDTETGEREGNYFCYYPGNSIKELLEQFGDLNDESTYKLVETDDIQYLTNDTGYEFANKEVIVKWS